jgi:hypothetical protein
MTVKTNFALGVDSYKIDFNFVQSKSGSSDRLAAISLYDKNNQRLAQLHFYPGLTSFSVAERTDYVDILMSSDHLKDVYQTLRGEKPLYITFFRDNNKVLNNAWLGTSTHEPAGEEEGKGA